MKKFLTFTEYVIPVAGVMTYLTSNIFEKYMDTDPFVVLVASIAVAAYILVVSVVLDRYHEAIAGLMLGVIFLALFEPVAGGILTLVVSIGVGIAAHLTRRLAYR